MRLNTSGTITMSGFSGAFAGDANDCDSINGRGGVAGSGEVKWGGGRQSGAVGWPMIFILPTRIFPASLLRHYGGDLILRQQAARTRGVALCRFTAPTPEEFVAVLMEALREPLPWEDHFAVIDDRGIRLFPLP